MQALLHDLVDGTLLCQPVYANAVGDISKMDLGNGFGRWNTMPMRRRRTVDVHLENVVAIERDAALDFRIADGFRDAVQRAEEGGLSAARWADQGGDLAFMDGQIHFMKGLEVTVVEIRSSERSITLEFGVGVWP